MASVKLYNGLPLNIPIVITHVTAALSIFGSMWIIIEISRDRKKRSRSCHRIVLGLSFFDLFSSFWFFIATWAQPNRVDFFSKYERHGTNTTCQISGFFIYLGALTIPPYNAALSLYYYLVICCRWREDRIRKQFERYVHIVIVSVALVLAIIPLFLDIYRPYYFYCFIILPSGTSRYQALFLIFYLASVICSTFIIITAMASISMNTRNIIRKCDSYVFQPRQSEQEKSSLGSSRLLQSIRSITTKRSSVSRRSRRRQRMATAISNAAILYVVPFLFTWFIPMVWYLCVFITFFTEYRMISVKNYLKAPMEVYLAIFLPLQGFINFLIYKRSRFPILWSRGAILLNDLVGRLVCCFFCLAPTNNVGSAIDDSSGSANEVQSSVEGALGEMALQNKDGNEIANGDVELFMSSLEEDSESGDELPDHQQHISEFHKYFVDEHLDLEDD